MVNLVVPVRGVGSAGLQAPTMLCVRAAVQPRLKAEPVSAGVPTSLASRNPIGWGTRVDLHKRRRTPVVPPPPSR